MPNYPKEQLQELYKDLPETLQEALFSEKVADNINEVCKKNKVEGKEVSEITKNIGYVFSGLLAPSEFRKTLEEEMGLDKKTSGNIASEIEALVFLPLKKELEGLYQEKIKKPNKKESSKKDKYREVTAE